MLAKIDLLVWLISPWSKHLTKYVSIVKGYKVKENFYQVNNTELFSRLKSLEDFTSLTQFLDSNLDMVQFILSLDQNLDGCLSNCSNRGRCQLYSNQLKCKCQKDFEGEMCENPLFCQRYLFLK